MAGDSVGEGSPGYMGGSASRGERCGGEAGLSEGNDSSDFWEVTEYRD